MRSWLRRWSGVGLVKLALVGVVLAAAAFLRLYRLEALPPGLFHDEAVNGLDVVDILRGQHPLFFTRNNGREPLFIYLQALSVFFFGLSPMALRLVSVVMGVLTVLATFLLAREWFGYRVGLLSMAGLAIAFWHVNLSRVGLRAIAAPLFLVLALFFLWRALRGDDLRQYALAGLMLSLSLYTYTAARVSIAIFGLILLLELIRDRAWLLHRWRGVALFAAVTIIIVAPLGAYFLAHPESLLGRMQEVAIIGVGFGAATTDGAAGQTQTLQQSLLRTAGMFFVAGDASWRHNYSGQPVFDPLSGAFFVLGCLWAIASLRRFRQSVLAACATRSPPGGESATVAVPWLIAWFGLALLPGVFSDQSPHFLRLTVLAPAAFMFAGLGYNTFWWWLRSRLGKAAERGFAVALALLLVWEGISTYHLYFDRWGQEPEVYRAFDTGLFKAATLVQGLPRDGKAYPALYMYAEPAPAIQLLAKQTYDGHWVREDSSVVILPADTAQDAYYLLSSLAVADVVSRHFPNLVPYRRFAAADGKEPVLIYRVPAEQVQAAEKPKRPIRVTLGGQLELVGVTPNVNLSPEVVAGSPVAVSLLWRVTTANASTYSFFVHAVDERGRLWGQQDLIGAKYGGWQVGDLVLSQHRIVVPADTPAIPMRLVAGVMLKDTGALLEPATKAPGSVVPLADFYVARPNPAGEMPIQRPANLVQKEIVPGLELIGYDRGQGPLQPGETLSLDLIWRLRAPLLEEPVIETRLVDGQGRVYPLANGAPGYGHDPFFRWAVGDIARDPRAAPVPGQVPSGRARLRVAALSPSTKSVLGELDLGSVDIQGRARNFDLPAPQHALDIAFGGQIRLLGFDLEPESIGRGREVKLTLYWQAIQTPSQNYTVFAHLLDAGDKVVGQKDNPPVQGTYPTGGWVPGEVVKDQYILALASEPKANELPLEVGLYEPLSGQRLKIDGTNEDRVILTAVKVR